MVSRTVAMIDQFWHSIFPVEKASQEGQQQLHEIMQEIDRLVDEKDETVTRWKKSRQEKPADGK